MNKLLIAVGLLGVAAVAIYFATRPEPTPTERLADAAEDAADAIQDAADEVSEAASEAGEAIGAEIEETTENMSAQMAEATAGLAEQVSGASEETRAALSETVDSWRATGIITDEGIDYDAATAAVAESDFSDETKSQMTSIIEFLRTAPGEATDMLAELETALAAN